MAPIRPAQVNGHGLGYASDLASANQRFSDIPSAIDIPVQGDEGEEAVEVNLEDLLDDPTELCTLLENEKAARNFWMVISLAYAKQRKVDHAIDVLTKGLGAMARGAPKEKLSMLSCLCWLYLWKSREAPRMIPEGALVSEAKTKDFYLQASTATLNEASRINPSFPPLFLARGVLYLLRASLQPPAKSTAPGAQDLSERVDTLRQAVKCFEDASRVSGGKNMMALLGKARALFSLGKYAEALDGYQKVLGKMPGLVDPDPRIGVGCCFWQLGFKDDARAAWERALDINPDSKIPNILLGLYHLDASSHLPTADPDFVSLYRKAMTQYTQKAFKLDNNLPLACATFGGYFLSRKAMPTVEGLARKAIELTDVNAIASDGWYLLARKEHFGDELSKASDYYRRADEARGGGDRGYLPAKFGIAQLQVLSKDLDGAKFRLEKIIQLSKNAEAMTLLGTLYAEDVFASLSSGHKEDKSTEQRKATYLLETVRMTWKDVKKHLTPDASVLLNLARLYETDAPDKSLQCLQQVEAMEIDQIPDEDRPQDEEDEASVLPLLRAHLPPQLLNNMGCFQYKAEKYTEARELFQTALSACIKLADKDESTDTDALVTTISYNLARTYEAAVMLDEASKVYEGLLERHEDYTDANVRLAYIALRQSPNEDGPKQVSKLMQNDSTDLEARALYGWYLSKSKKRTANIAEDPEQRHYKHTLQYHDKHDRYSLTGLGNLWLTMARDMRRDTDTERDKRRKSYERAVELFDKALQLDPKNAYAAQGIAIALVEDRKDFGAAVQIFAKIRDTLRDASVLINLGNVYVELKQFTRAIENFEAALAKDRQGDAQILTYLGRVWLFKAKQEKNAVAMKTSLDYAQQALATSPDHIIYRFNVAFVQIQLAQLLYSLPETQRTLDDVQAAARGLDEAIVSLDEIAKSKNPPYPRGDIEQRANMGRNTMRRQLDRAVQAQREYEEKNAAKLKQAREARDAELKKREMEKQEAEERANEHKRRIAEERHRMQEVDRELAEKRMEEERRHEAAEMTTDEETGEKVKKKKQRTVKRRKKDQSADASGTDGEGVNGASKKTRRKRRKSGTGSDSGVATSTDEETGSAPKKRRKLERKTGGGGGASNKYKSSEIVVESDSDEDADGGDLGTDGKAADEESLDEDVRGGTKEGEDLRMSDAADSDDADEAVVGRSQTARKKLSRAIAEDDDDEEEDADEGEGGGDAVPNGRIDDDDDDDGPQVAAEDEGDDAGGRDTSMHDVSAGAGGDGDGDDGDED
ncbi:MAG: hypothetical protein M1817_006360 [Caeruleum heppii]|nr:MAG: hypothetical protein M1817_006360 [Caeruleum heppii]